MMCKGSSAAIERMLDLGRELQQTSQSLRRDLGKSKQNKTMLQVRKANIFIESVLYNRG